MGQSCSPGVTGALGNCEDPARLVSEFLIRNNGNLTKTAYQLGIMRPKLYEKLYELELWPLVNYLRKDAVSRRRIMKSLDR
jgi:hypothetical protein